MRYFLHSDAVSRGRRSTLYLSPCLHPSAASQMPPWSTCVFDQAPGVLPARRETIEGIGGGRMPCASVWSQCGTRCLVETCRNSRCMPGHAVPLGCSCGWALQDVMRATCQCAKRHMVQGGKLAATTCRGMACTVSLGRQLRALKKKPECERVGG